MRPARKLGDKRTVLTVLAVIAALVVLLGIGACAYLNNINKLMGLGNQKGDIEFMLSDMKEGDPYYVLLIGSDSREGVESSDYEWAGKSLDPGDGVADVIILVRVDPETKLITMLSVPRDTPWQYEDGTWNKLNSVYRTLGVPGIISAVSQISGVPISHYAEVHMSQFMEIVDVLGGITVDVPSRIEYHEALTNEPVVIEEGLQRLNGAEAEVFARERKSLGTDQEMKRQSHVRTIIMAMLDEIKGKPIWELPDIITACAQCVSTDYSVSDLISLYNSVGSHATVYSGTAPYAGDNNPNADNLWMCYLDPEGWSNVMAVVSEGGDPSTVSYENDEVSVAGS